MGGVGRQFGGVPERWKEEGIFVHRRCRVKVGDEVEAIRTVLKVIAKGTRLRISNVIVEPDDNDRGFKKGLQFDGVDGVFNPNRFIKVAGYLG